MQVKYASNQYFNKNKSQDSNLSVECYKDNLKHSNIMS